VAVTLRLRNTGGTAALDTTLRLLDGETEVARASLPALPAGAAPAVAASLILLLGVLNWRGLKTGAGTSDVLTVVKVLALVLFVAVGMFFVSRENVTALGTPDLKGFGEGMFAALFTLSGFEFVAVVAGETENPRRNIPLSIVGSLVGAVVLYALIQLVIIGTLPTVTSAKAPMVEAASAFGDGPAEVAFRLAGLVSMVGFCSGSALVGPRLVASLARDGVLPKAVASRSEQGTPNLGIALVTGGAMLAVAFLGFKELADLTIVTLFAQYVPTTLAVIVFRIRRPNAPRLFRVPLGPVIPVLALAIMTLLITRIGSKALITTGVILAIGAVVVLLTRLVEGKPAASAGEGPTSS